MLEVRDCASTGCHGVVEFRMPGEAQFTSVRPDDSITVPVVCGVCGGRQHALFWRTGELSGPWLSVR